MTRLEALEAVAAAARDLLAHERVYLNDLRSGSPLRIGRAAEKRAALLLELRRSVVTLNPLDQSAPQPPGADPQPHRGGVADTAGIFDGPDSVEWLREQRGVPMIPDLLAQAYGADALAALDRLEASTHDASGGPPAPHRRPSEDPT